MASFRNACFKRLTHDYSRYILLTVVGSFTLLCLFNWAAETALLSAAGAGMLLEVFLSHIKSKQFTARDGHLLMSLGASKKVND